jgi:hypothetical protein
MRIAIIPNTAQLARLNALFNQVQEPPEQIARRQAA